MQPDPHRTTISRRKEMNALHKFYGSRCMNINCINSEEKKKVVNKRFLEIKNKPTYKIIKFPSSKKLEFAHIQPTNLSGMGRGKSERLKDIKNNPKCYVLLCQDCHKYLDSLTEQEERKQLIIQINRRKIEILQLRYLESKLKLHGHTRDFKKFLMENKSLIGIDIIYPCILREHKKFLLKMINGYLS